MFSLRYVRAGEKTFNPETTSSPNIDRDQPDFGHSPPRLCPREGVLSQPRGDMSFIIMVEYFSCFASPLHRGWLFHRTINHAANVEQMFKHLFRFLRRGC